MSNTLKLVLCSLICILGLQISAGAQEKRNLSILYIGGTTDYNSDSPETKDGAIADRMKSFEDFLNERFTKVTVIKGNEYKEEMSGKYDVTIFDGPVPPVQPTGVTLNANGQIEKFYKAVELSENFSNPSILIADMGDIIGRGIGTKTDWFCLCLNSQAFGTDFNHPIFKGPFKVDIKTRTEPTPENTFGYQFLQDEKIPTTVQMWDVQTKGYETDRDFRIGMVSRPWGFLDSPETEVISGGKSQKSIDAVAIGRHGNFFFWGFSGSPKYMTEQGKEVFANAIVYTASLKGSRTIARKYNDRRETRVFVRRNIYFASHQAYEDRIKMDKENFELMSKMKKEAIEKNEKGEKLNEAEQYYLSAQLKEKKPQPYEEYLKEVMDKDYDKFKGNTKAYIKYFKDNTPYMFYGENGFEIDQDALSLKIPNNSIKLLDKAISMLEKNKEADKARRILNRYTLCTFETAEEWREWFNTNKDKIFFSENGGWVFLVNSLDKNVEGNDYFKKAEYDCQKQIKLAPTNSQNPVEVGAALVTYPNGRQAVLVKMNIEKGYHTYANVSEKDPFIPTKIELSLPDKYRAGNMICPMSNMSPGSTTTLYEGSNVFVIPIYGVGKGEITVKCGWQCCDNQVCLQPTEKTITLKTTLENYR